MKTKPALITLGVLVVAATLFFFVRGRNLSRPEKNGVLNFLIAFNTQVRSGNVDSLANFFDVKQNEKVLKHFLNVLTNKSGFKEGTTPLFNLMLDPDQSSIRIVNSEIAEAKVPAYLRNDSIASKKSGLRLRIRKVSANVYKIIQVDANKFMTDYLAYENLVRNKMSNDSDIYSAITLKAFETAKQLKTKYDTVVWFAHDGDKTYFYVANGKWDEGFDHTYYRKDTVAGAYKMGLVGPDLKEIIPVEFDLIHNIGGTFPGLIEVEKGNKKGFYDLNGKVVLPVNYDQIFPLNDEENLAVLRNGDDYFYLKQDMSVSDKTDLKVSDFFSKIKMIGGAVNLSQNQSTVITEYNSREVQGQVLITPSYLVDLNMIGKIENFKNPLRKLYFEDGHTDYKIGSANEVKDDNNWLTASFYSVRDYFVGGRSEFYDSKNIVIVDKKRNRIFSQAIRADYTRDEDEEGSLEGQCDISSIRAINDSLYEVKSGAILYFDLYDSTRTVTGGPYYHYLVIRKNKLTELPDERFFGFTKYVKMDDTYLNACYNMVTGEGHYDSRKKETINRITSEMLSYMKNEIYADYGYQFKDKRWQVVFQDMPKYGQDKDGNPKPGLASVNDSLTDIDKYNINWINQKLKGSKGNSLAAK